MKVMGQLPTAEPNQGWHLDSTVVSQLKREVVGVFPASPMQEELWVIAQMAPGNSAYNLGEAWRLDGELNVQALRQAFDALVRRHETLRTAFGARGGRPVQLVLQPRPFDLTEVDLASAPDPKAELEQRMAAEARCAFDLGSGALARAVVYRLAPDEHVLFINLHHIISDEWSLGVFRRELAAGYAAFASGQAWLPDELPIQYADFSVWLRDSASSNVWTQDLTYWREQLRGPLPRLYLPADRARPGKFGYKGKTHFGVLPAPLLEKLQEISRAEGVTLYMTLLAGFKVLLHRLTRQSDVLIGSPMAGRERLETEDLIGLFVNVHGVRTDLSGDPTFRELLGRVREVVLGACAHQTVPVDQVVEAVQPEREPGRHPLYNVVFGLQTAQTDHWTLPGLRTSRIETDNAGSKFDWTLLLTETSAGVRFRSEYSTDLFEPGTMAQAARYFETLLRGITQDPARRISQLSLLTPEERTRCLLEPKRAALNVKPTISGPALHVLFEEQAARSPESIALTLQDESLTYEALNAKANQLASYLVQVGIRRESPVALCLERSLDMVVAILAVLKAGGAYVPIEPTIPAERVRFMLEDTQAPVVITQQGVKSVLAGCSSKILCLDSDREIIARESTRNLPSQTAPENIAYIIYTSGSTGKPKGVLVTHQNVIRLFQQTEPWFGFGASDVWPLFHSYAFDFSVWELWGALLYGGRLVMVPHRVSRSPAEFYQLLVKEKVTVLNQTPSAFRQLIWAETDGGAQGALKLRFVICGGEALELQSLRPWFQKHGDQEPKVINMYGITETTVHVTYRVIREQDLTNGLGSVIGVPIPDLELRLLDEQLEPVPLGVTGEICVSGAGVARGYLHRPELTRTRFVPDPFSSPPGARLYRSGDLARRTATGELEYLGRKDQQVKIRGFRIELGEIESALNTHPAVRESSVIAYTGPVGDARLAAYVVPAGKPAEPEVLRQHLANLLPEYMIPAVFIPLDSLPLTGNGKVAREALPAPEVVSSNTQVPIEPRNPIESSIAQIWGELLGRKTVSVLDNFFHLGGHSLLATQAVSRIAAKFNLDVPVTVLFEAPTVADLATAITRVQRDQAGRLKPITSRVQPRSAEDLLSRLDELTDEQVDELLEQMQGQTVSP